MADSYTSRLNTDAMLVPALAATVYSAHESSLYLGGMIIPSVSAPNGVLQVPELATVAAGVLDTDFTGDVTNTVATDTKNTINCDLYANRSVVRDLGNIDPSEIGRVLGRGVAEKFDAAVNLQLGSLTAQEITAGDLDMAEVSKAVATIRGNGETGQLFGVISTNAYSALMNEIGSAAFAGGDQFQSQAMRSGFFGNIMGVQTFVSSHLNDTNTGVTGSKMAIFGADALRIAMQKNVDLEIARRAEAVGWDVVASLHAGVGLIDASRGVLIQDTV